MQRFLSCDWGTTSFRLREVESEPFRIVAEIRSDRGTQAVRDRLLEAGTPPEQAFPCVLTEELDRLAREAGGTPNDLPIIVSGMASSSIGWKELPYADVPFSLTGESVTAADCGAVCGATGTHRITLVSGLRTEDDVLRGEETEVLGFLSCDEYAACRESSLLILPGTHSKHVTIDNGYITSFRTYMTGELFSVLSRHGILRHSLMSPEGGSEPSTDGTDDTDAACEESFRNGVVRGRTGALSGKLFTVRTNQVLHSVDAAANRAYLSGLLIGSELAEAQTTATGGRILLCAGKALASSYRTASEVLDMAASVTQVPPPLVETASTRGHSLLFSRISAGGLR